MINFPTQIPDYDSHSPALLYFFLSSEASICSINLLNLKQSSDRLVIIAKRFLKLPNLHILITRKSPSLPRDLALSDSWQIANSVPKVNLLHICYSTLQGCCILHLIKQNCLLKTFLTTLILMTQLYISLPVFPFRTNLKMHNISVTPKMVKKVITNLDLTKTVDPDCILVVVLKNCEPELSYILAELLNNYLKESCFPAC